MTSTDRPSVAPLRTDAGSFKPKTEFRAEFLSLLAIAIPNVAGTAAETIMSLVDFAVVSQLGPEAQAAVSSGGLVYFCLFAFLLGMMICVTTVVSQSLGAGRLRDCSRYGWQGIWLSMLFGILGFVLWPVVPAVFAWIGHEQVVQGFEVDYTRIRLLGLGLAGACVALGHFFNGIHQPRQNAYSVVATVILNVILSIGLVCGKWGLPEMGVAGAAWGTVIANFVRLIWLMVAMCAGRHTRQFEPLANWMINMEKMGRLFKVGWPAGVSFVLDVSAWSAFFVLIVGRFGTVHLAAMATCWRYTELSFMPAVGIGHAISTLVGRAIGESRPRLARYRAMLGACLNMAYMTLLGLAFVVFGRPLMDLFSDEADVIDLGVWMMRLAAMYQLFDAVAISYGNALRGAGDTLWPAIVTSFLSWLITVVGASLVASLHPEWGSLGPWTVATLDIVLCGVILAARWRWGPWEKLDIIGRTKSDRPENEFQPESD